MTFRDDAVMREGDFRRIFWLSLGLPILFGMGLLMLISTAPPDARLVPGAQVYVKHCVACHGGAGGGIDHFGAPVRPSAFIADRSAEALADIVSTGRAGTLMPAFAGTLTRSQMADVAAFLKAWQAPSAPETAYAIVLRPGEPTPTLSAAEIRADCQYCHQGRVKPLEPRPPDDA